MTRKLDIIIPHYKESWQVCHYLFDSLAMQRGINFNAFRCVVVNDGDDTSLDDIEFSRYPYETVYVKKPHGGISDTRNYGLDYSDAEYVMFCDCDDGFLNNYGLYMVFTAIVDGFDLLNPNFAEETMTDKEHAMVLIGHKDDLTFMHGKVYRRQFLVDHNLRFDPEMTIHEDGYFNLLVHATIEAENGKTKRVETPYYLWCWNCGSTVRKDKEDFVLRTYFNVMQTRIGLCKQLKERGYEDAYASSVGMTVLNSYYDFQKPAWNSQKNEKHRRAAEKEFRKFWVLFKKDFLDLTNKQIAEMAKAARQTATNNGMLMEKTDLKTFLKHIEYEVKP